MIRSLARNVLDRLPYTAAGNRLYWLGYYVYAHRRLPKPGRRLFNDYLFSLKTSGALASPLRRRTSDKIEVKAYVTQKLGNGYCPETLAVLSDAEAMRGLDLDTPHVVKPAHSSGYVLFVEQTPYAFSDADVAAMREGLDYDLYRANREINYRGLAKRLVVEEAITSKSAVRDYKVFCYRGAPRLIQVDYDRHQGHTRTLYTAGWEALEITYAKRRGPSEPRPAMLDRMLEVSRILAADFESVRVDFYLSDDRLLIGELTHCPEQGHGRFGSLAQEQLFSDIYFG